MSTAEKPQKIAILWFLIVSDISYLFYYTNYSVHKLQYYTHLILQACYIHVLPGFV